MKTNRAVFLLFVPFLLNTGLLAAQDSVITLSADLFNDEQVIFLTDLEGWIFKQGNDPAWASPDIETADWESLRPADITFDYAEESSTFEGWFRIKIEIDSTLAELPLYWRSGTLGAMNLYLDGELIQSYGKPDSDFSSHRGYNPYNRIPDRADLESGREYLLAIYLVDHHSALENRFTFRLTRLDPWLRLAGPEFRRYVESVRAEYFIFQAVWFTALFMLTILFWTISLRAKNDDSIKLITWLNTLLFLSVVVNAIKFEFTAGIGFAVFDLLFAVTVYLGIGFVPMVITQILDGEVPDSLRKVFVLYVFLAFLDFWVSHFAFTALAIFLIILITGFCIFKSRDKISGSKWFVVVGLLLTVVWMLAYALANILAMPDFHIQNLMITFVYLTLPISLLLFISVRFNEILITTREHSREIVKLSQEKLAAEKERQRIIENQKVILEKEVQERTKELQKSLENLKAAQEQLVQQEKLASLGQLTAGIAHEIKNPLNFVNNFSEVSLELIEEVREEVKSLTPNMKRESKKPPLEGGKDDEAGQGDDAEPGYASNPDFILEILDDIEANLRKIHEHGSRADGTVKSMLLHSRGGSGEMEPADLNVLVKEYINLAFHGMRAGKEPINVDIDLQLDESIGEVPMIVEDFTRVILNLVNNAFDAMREKVKVIRSEVENREAKSETEDQSAEAIHELPLQDSNYQPKLTIRTKSENGQILIEVQDNGPGIPDEIKDNILQPFFTTKKGTQGTGLGLSITNDIVKAHGGELSLVSNPQVGTMFRIAFPNK